MKTSEIVAYKHFKLLKQELPEHFNESRDFCDMFNLLAVHFENDRHERLCLFPDVDPWEVDWEFDTLECCQKAYEQRKHCAIINDGKLLGFKNEIALQ